MDPEGPTVRPDGAGSASHGPEEPVDPESGVDPSSHALLHAFTGISSDLDTRSVLSRILLSACDLTGARSGGLGLIGHDGGLRELVPHGLDQPTIDRIGSRPHGWELLDTPGLQVPVRVRGTTLGVLFLTEKRDGRPFTDRDELLAQALVNVAGFVIENARAYSLSERRRRWLELFGELNELLMPPIALPEALDRIVTAVRGAAEAMSATIVQVPEQGDAFIAARVGENTKITEEEAAGFDVAVRSVINDGAILHVDFRDVVVVMVPLRAHLTVPGALCVTYERLSDTDELEERELLTSFADQAALAIDRTQALEDREQLAVISDRDRIARDLHDVVIQRLFATGLQMQSIRQLATTDELRTKMDQNVRDLDQTIRDIRSTIFELQHRPQNSLRTEVRDLVREYVPVLGFAPSVQMHGDVDMSVEPKLQQQLVAALREALANVAQHAEAGSASIDLQVTATHLRLRVTDNGKGVPDDREESGIRNARRRAVMLGGSLDLWPGDPTGTAFIWSVPFERVAATS
ncbi:MAG TPA: histidine kinase [Marmoricola sp.]|nr:histidine kinase [Marmoricola sp.]